jgi:hypothetical protein
MRMGFEQVLTVITPPGPDAAAAAAHVRELCPAAAVTYAVGGTQKFRLPSAEVGGDPLL